MMMMHGDLLADLVAKVVTWLIMNMETVIETGEEIETGTGMGVGEEIGKGLDTGNVTVMDTGIGTETEIEVETESEDMTMIEDPGKAAEGIIMIRAGAMMVVDIIVKVLAGAGAGAGVIAFRH